MLLKNTCHGVHISLQAYKPISLQACKFVKNELLHTYVLRIVLLNFKLLFIVFFKESFPGRGLHFSMGGGFAFQIGGASFLNEGVPHGGESALVGVWSGLSM